MNKKTLSRASSIALIAIALTISVLPFAAQASQVDDTVTALYNSAVAVGASVAVIGWVIAGGLYLTSAGSPQRMGIAKAALVAAVIGTILVVLASSSGNLTSFIKGVFGLH